MAGTVDREPPLVGVAGVAEPAQLEDRPVGEDPVDVDEPSSEAGVDPGEVRPAFPSPGRQTRKNTSVTPRFFRSVSTASQYLADSPPPCPGQIPRMSL